MILSKIMLNLTDDANSLIAGKYGIKYAGVDLEAMKAVAEAHSKRSLKEF